MQEIPTKYKILVIDDEDGYRNIIVETLESSGYIAFEASNGMDGLAAAKQHFPDLILCDVNMPKMDGLTLLNTLKEEEKFSEIPFIFLTGNAEPEDMRKGMRMGADDYLTKPFSIEELIKAVETRLKKKEKLKNYYESQYEEIKSTIVSSLPHEFRTPLNSILGFSQILKDEENLKPEDLKEIGGMIHKSGERLHRLLENMVLYSQLQLFGHDQKRITAMRSEVSQIKDVAESLAVKMMERHNRPGDVHVSVEPAAGKISNTNISKIIEEILDNALKFSQPKSNVQISGTIKNNNVVIAIRDEGRGMTDEQITKISGFQQFDRNYFEQQGAGLGLIIAKLMCQIHEGVLTIESTNTSGTTVTVTLPLADSV